MAIADLWAPVAYPPGKLDSRKLDHMLAELLARDELFIRLNPRTPLLYESGVFYEREPPGQELWLPIPWVLMRRDIGRGADCEDLACWRAAELRVRGEPPHWKPENATVFHTNRMTPKGRLYHILVRRASGHAEDPSVILGMGKDSPEFAKYWGPKHSIAV